MHGRGGGDGLAVGHVRPQHLVFHLDLVGGQEEAMGAEQRGCHRLGTGVQQPQGLKGLAARPGAHRRHLRIDPGGEPP